MKDTMISGNKEIASIPWEDWDLSCDMPIWRYSQNPIIRADSIKCSNSIYNSAVVKFEDGYAGVFRCDDKARMMNLHSGFSNDGINWEINESPIEFVSDDEGVDVYNGYDPRVCWLEDRYYITWCNCHIGPSVGISYTFDFKTFYQLENAFLPYNRNGVLFPKKIRNKYMMLSRPSDDGHTPFGDIYISESPDMIHWGRHRLVMSSKKGWQETKIGAGPIPIETEEGWLVLYHGVLTSCNGFIYSIGAAILDLDNPSKVIYRTHPYIMAPKENYERIGDVPNVIFPCAALHEESTGRLAIYYGAADTVTCLAFTQLDILLDFIKNNSKV